VYSIAFLIDFVDIEYVNSRGHSRKIKKTEV